MEVKRKRQPAGGGKAAAAKRKRRSGAGTDGLAASKPPAAAPVVEGSGDGARVPAEPGWFSKSECAAIFGVSEEGFRKYYRPLAPETDVRRDSRGRISIRVRGLIEAWVHKQLDKQRAEFKAELESVGGDPALMEEAGGKSPALERYRLAKAGQEEINLARMRNDVLPRDSVRTIFQSVAGALRELQSELEDHFGLEARFVAEECLAQVERETRGLFSRHPQAEASGDDSGGSDRGSEGDVP